MSVRVSSGTPTVQSLERGLRILEVLAQASGGLSLAQVAGAVGLHRSTAHRLLTTLAGMGYVERGSGTGEDSEGYRLGLKVIELGSLRLGAVELRTEAQPLLRRLAQATGETVHLAILRDGRVSYIDKIESFDRIRMYSDIGKEAPPHCTGVGKVLLSGLTEAELEQVIQGRGLRRYTAHTITDPARLQCELKQVRTQGYALDDEEHELGIRCIAAPICDYRGKIIAAMSLTAPRERLDDEAIQRLAPKVREVALAISRRIGYRGEDPWGRVSAPDVAVEGVHHA